MNIQAIKDKIQELLDAQEKLVQDALNETRDMNEDEQKSFDEIDLEIKAFEEMIKDFENTIDGVSVEDGKGEGEDPVNVTDEELTECLDKFIRDDRTEEEVTASGEHRAFKFPTADGSKLNVTANNGIIIPKHIANFILQKMEEHSNVFGEIVKYPAVNGEFAITRDTDNELFAGRVAEGNEFTDFKKLSFDQVKMWQERYVAGYVITQHLIHNSKFDLVSYAMEKLAMKMSRTIENEIFNGSATLNQKNMGFRGLKGEANIHSVALGVTTNGVALNPAGLNMMITRLHPSYLQGSKFYMNRHNYQKVAIITKEGTAAEAQYLVQNGIVNGKLGRTLYGFEIVVTDVLDDNTVYFGNMSKTSGMTIKKGFELRHIFGDSVQAVAATHLLLLDIYMDGAVINPDAMVKGTVETPNP